MKITDSSEARSSRSKIRFRLYIRAAHSHANKALSDSRRSNASEPSVLENIGLSMHRPRWLTSRIVVPETRHFYIEMFERTDAISDVDIQQMKRPTLDFTRKG